MAREATSYENAVDLYKFATKAADSGDLTILMHGFLAVSNCLQVKSDRANYEAMAAANSGNQQTRAKAAQVILDRCKGFLDNDMTALHGLRRSIAQKIRASNEYVPGVTHHEMTDQQFRAIIDRSDFFSFGGAVSQIQGRSLAKQGIAENSRAEFQYLMGYKLALCDIGGDCSGESLNYLQTCATQGFCPGSVEKGWLQGDGVSAADVSTASRYRREVAAAFQSRNYAYFGF